jgi:AraC family transcriptional regulator of adaptative response/methylated-DNA-[protein]-cysteine methyltransferase
MMVMLKQVVVVETDTDEKRWDLVCERSVAAEELFVFAVESTGIYCRSSCPSRRAKRENVVFFDAGLQAESEGFRACKRDLPPNK